MNRRMRWPRLFWRAGALRAWSPGGRPSPAMKRFMARYIYYLELFGYVAVSLVALAVVSCFFFKVDDVIRLDGDPVPIKPRSEPIKRTADALVTRVFIQNHQSVRKGDPLIEVVEEPKWMSRYLVMHQMQTMLDEFDAPGQASELAKKRIEEAQKAAREAALASVRKAGPSLTETEKKEEEKPPLPRISFTPQEETLRATMKQRLAEWEAGGVAKSPRVVVRAPIDGMVLAPDDLSFKKVDADAQILQVVDLNDLRLSGKLSGQTVADARTGQKARIKAIFPDYKNGTVFRGDTVPRGRFFWQKERVTSYGLIDPKIKDVVKDGFKNRKITQRDDIPFDLTEVTDVEVDADVRSAVVHAPLAASASAGEGRAFADASPITSPPGNAASAQPPAPISADPPAELALRGRVLEGKHRLTVQLADMPPGVTRQVREMVASQLRGKVVDAPQEPEEGKPAGTRALRVDAVRGVTIIAKVKGENGGAKGPTGRLKRQAARHAIRGASLERQYEATVQLQNPPQFLKDRVLELLEQGKEVKARMEIITGRRRVAFLLLRR
jgi:multidrug resistance efflux pump